MKDVIQVTETLGAPSRYLVVHAAEVGPPCPIAQPPSLDTECVPCHMGQEHRAQPKSTIQIALRGKPSSSPPRFLATPLHPFNLSLVLTSPQHPTHTPHNTVHNCPSTLSSLHEQHLATSRGSCLLFPPPPDSSRERISLAKH